VVKILTVVFFVMLNSLALAGEKTLTPQSFFDRYKPSYIKVNAKGDIWVAYYDLKGVIHIRNLSKKRELMVNEDRKAGSGLAFDVQGDKAFVVWREKLHKKRLWFRASYDGGKTLTKPILIDEKTEALTRIKLASNFTGKVFVTWYGEKRTGDSDYNIYCAASDDFGRSFSEAKNLTLGYRHSIYPTLLADEKGAYVFSYSSRQGKKYMIFRKTTGKNWSEATDIKEIGIVTLFVEPIKIENRLYVFWFNTYDDIPIIEGAYSDDNGKTWKTEAFEDTRGLDVGLLRVAHDSKDHIYVAFYGKRKEKEKNKMYIMRSEDKGTTWKRPVPVRHYPFENTAAKGLDIIAKDNGEVVIAWVDYRNIRSNLYMQYSENYGGTWHKKDIALEEPGRFNTRHFPYTDSLVKLKDRYYILAYRFKDDITLNAAELLLIDFILGER
jgi:hypothetical protein